METSHGFYGLEFCQLYREQRQTLMSWAAPRISPRASNDSLRNPQRLLSFAAAACILSHGEGGSSQDQRDGSAVKGTYCSFRKPMVGGFPTHSEVAHNCLYLSSKTQLEYSYTKIHIRAVKHKNKSKGKSKDRKVQTHEQEGRWVVS